MSLLDSFNIEIAAAAAGLPRDADAQNLVERPFITDDPDAPWRYRLHDLIRSAVRDADSTAEDRWSAADWRRAAQRGFDILGDQMPSRGELGQRWRLMACLSQGLRLASEFQLELGWLIDAAWQYVAESVWEPIEIPTDRLEGPGSAVGALASTLSALARRQRVHRQQTVDELTEILNSGTLPREAEDLARYYLAECQRHLGLYESSAANMHRVASGRNPLAGDAARGLAHIARHLGDFPAAMEATEALVHDTRYHRALGHLWWIHGRISLACSAYGAARDVALTQANAGQAALAQASLALAAGFEDRALASEQIQRAEDLLQGVHLSWAETHVDIARLLRDAGSDLTLPERAAELELQAEEAGLGSSVAYIRLAVCFHQAVMDKPEELRAARARLGLSAEGGEYTYLVEISHFLDGSEPLQDLPRARWIGGEDATARRWHDLVNDRRAALGPDLVD